MYSYITINIRFSQEYLINLLQNRIIVKLLKFLKSGGIMGYAIIMKGIVVFPLIGLFGCYKFLNQGDYYVRKERKKICE